MCRKNTTRIWPILLLECTQPSLILPLFKLLTHCTDTAKYVAFSARELASQAPLQVQKDTKAAAAAPAPAPASAAPTEEEEKNQDGSAMSRR